jgi:hypothetical protein
LALFTTKSTLKRQEGKGAEKKIGTYLKKFNLYTSKL